METTYLLPAHWVFPLIYDNYTAIEDNEEKEIRDFLENTPGYPVCPEDYLPEFSSFNDAGTLACDCINITFIDNESDCTTKS